MCAGDTTLEKAMVVDGALKNEVNGWGTAHQCRDWDAIWAFTSAHKWNDKMGIL